MAGMNTTFPKNSKSGSSFTGKSKVISTGKLDVTKAGKPAHIGQQSVKAAKAK